GEGCTGVGSGKIADAHAYPEAEFCISASDQRNTQVWIYTDQLPINVGNMVIDIDKAQPGLRVLPAYLPVFLSVGFFDKVELYGGGERRQRPGEIRRMPDHAVSPIVGFYAKAWPLKWPLRHQAMAAKKQGNKNKKT